MYFFRNINKKFIISFPILFFKPKKWQNFASSCYVRSLFQVCEMSNRIHFFIKSTFNFFVGENGELAAVVKRLKETVMNLKAEVLAHANGGCQLMIPDPKQLLWQLKLKNRKGWKGWRVQRGWWKETLERVKRKVLKYLLQLKRLQ